MENYPNNNPETNQIPETIYSKKFYELLDKFENIKRTAEDPNASEEQRKNAQAEIEKWGEKIEESLDELDELDKEERDKMALKAEEAVKARDLASPEREQSADNAGTYISQDGLVGTDPSIKKASGYDNWVSHED